MLRNASRRSALRLGGTALLGSLAGCPVLGTQSEIRIGELWVTNLTEEEHTVRLRIEDRGEEVYREAVAVPATDGDFGTRAAAPRPPTSPGAYVLYARLDGTGETQYDFAQHDVSCFNLEVRVGTGRGGPVIEFWGGGGDAGEDCSTSTR